MRYPYCVFLLSSYRYKGMIVSNPYDPLTNHEQDTACEDADGHKTTSMKCTYINT